MLDLVLLIARIIATVLCVRASLTLARRLSQIGQRLTNFSKAIPSRRRRKKKRRFPKIFRVSLPFPSCPQSNRRDQRTRRHRRSRIRHVS
jgi:hypothetical protein